MKTIKILSILILVALVDTSCEKNDEGPVINTTPTAAVIQSPGAGTDIAITADNLTDSLYINWSSAEYGVAVESDYEVQMAAADSDFSSPISLGSAPAAPLGITYQALNEAVLNTLGGSVGEPFAVKIRVRAALVHNQYESFSEEVSFNITPYGEIVTEEPESLWVPGFYQNFLPAEAPEIREISPNVFEGYVYVSAAGGIKFTSAPDWDNVNYGYAADGQLTTDGLAPDIPVDVAGYYRMQVDITALTYELILVETWGLIGTATPGAWDVSTPMNFDAETGLWSQTLNLANGALKFRANDEWSLNYGPQDSNSLDGTLIHTDNAITIPAAGNYTVTIDLSRNEPPYVYSYTVVLN